jgi:Terpene cyclase DEP1
MDVLVSALVLVVSMCIESARLNIRRRWLPVLAMLTVGVSLGFPMFLYLRALSMEQVKASGNSRVPA